jgi:methylthioribose-1-phosphate isomerase
MKVGGQHFRSIWLTKEHQAVMVIDQQQLPFRFELKQLNTVTDAATAISDMVVRGAPLIGATAACGLLLAAAKDPSEDYLSNAAKVLVAARPTAINLRWAVDRILPRILAVAPSDRLGLARVQVGTLCEEDITRNSRIGDHGFELLKELSLQKSNTQPQPLNILTHCNAGWLATVDWGTALAPIFKAFDAGLEVHVWVDETRPRNQGASLTAWELQAHGIPHTLIADNAGGHLMQQGQVDICIVGSDRTANNGDVCNKIGTYLKALAAYDNGIPFYAAVPSPTIDWSCQDGRMEIPIEERKEEEVLFISGALDDGQTVKVRIAPEGSRGANPAFDVTPRRLVTGIITDRGICRADEESLLKLYPEQRSSLEA